MFRRRHLTTPPAAAKGLILDLLFILAVLGIAFAGVLDRLLERPADR